jgi:hypothetical protein
MDKRSSGSLKSYLRFAFPQGGVTAFRLAVGRFSASLLNKLGPVSSGIGPFFFLSENQTTAAKRP